MARGARTGGASRPNGESLANAGSRGRKELRRESAGRGRGREGSRWPAGDDALCGDTQPILWRTCFSRRGASHTAFQRAGLSPRGALQHRHGVLARRRLLKRAAAVPQRTLPILQPPCHPRLLSGAGLLPCVVGCQSALSGKWCAASGVRSSCPGAFDYCRQVGSVPARRGGRFARPRFRPPDPGFCWRRR